MDYRRRGGVRRSPLPDFYIGAHAAVTGRALLTRDVNRYGGQLPSLRLINPDPPVHRQSRRASIVVYGVM
jgi:predicted nucleic acid-binding protein